MHQTGETEIVIAPDTGLPESISVKGVDLLCVPQNTEHGVPLVQSSGSTKPCRMQLHRAPTDNDRYGYTFIWNALGLDKEMLYATKEFVPIQQTVVPSSEIPVGPHLHCSKFVDMARLANRSDGSVGVSCKWKMVPAKLDRCVVSRTD